MGKLNDALNALKNFKDSAEEDIISWLRKTSVKQDETVEFGDWDNGLFIQIQNVGRHEHEDISKFKHVSPKLSSHIWLRIWDKKELVYSDEGPMMPVKSNAIKFLQQEITPVNDSPDEDDLWIDSINDVDINKEELINKIKYKPLKYKGINYKVLDVDFDELAPKDTIITIVNEDDETKEIVLESFLTGVAQMEEGSANEFIQKLAKDVKEESTYKQSEHHEIKTQEEANEFARKMAKHYAEKGYTPSQIKKKMKEKEVENRGYLREEDIVFEEKFNKEKRYMPSHRRFDNKTVRETYQGDVDKLIEWLKKAITKIDMVEQAGVNKVNKDLHYLNKEYGTEYQPEQSSNRLGTYYIAHLTSDPNILKEMPNEVKTWKAPKNEGLFGPTAEKVIAPVLVDNKLTSNAVILDLLYNYGFNLGKQIVKDSFNKLSSELAKKIEEVKEPKALYPLEDEISNALDDSKISETQAEELWKMYDAKIDELSGLDLDITKDLPDEIMIYQFPASMNNKKDLSMARRFGLEVLGKVNENGYQPGDIIIKGKMKDLERYCDEYLGYVMHPDYLYKAEEFDVEDVVEAL